MPKCKYCGARLTKFDKERCPVCGAVAPFANDQSQTVDITKEFDFNNPELKDATPRFRKKVFLYFALLGWCGYPFYYLRKKKMFPIWGAINIVLIVGFSVLFSYVTKMIWLGILIGIGIIELVNICYGLFYLLFPDIKDGSGEFLL